MYVTKPKSSAVLQLHFIVYQETLNPEKKDVLLTKKSMWLIGWY